MIYDCEQHSAEWAALRMGKVTSSRISDVLAEIKRGEAAKRANYRAELISETLTGVAVSRYITPEMRHGVEHERYARAAYEIAADVLTSTIGFATHPTIERLGASPDGLIGDDGVLELKCPNTSTHLEYRLAGIVPAEYEAQMLVQMACTGRAWCEFVSYDPRLPADLQLFVRRFHRDDARIAEIERQVLRFLEELDEVIGRLRLPAATAARPTPAPVAVASTPRKKKVAIAPPAAVDGIRSKPRIDDMDPKTNRPVFSNYGEYEEAKDLWLLEESLRQAETARRRERIEVLMRPTATELDVKKRIVN